MKCRHLSAAVTLFATTAVVLSACAIDASDQAKENEDTASVDQAIGGPPKCKSTLPGGQPNPEWPQCLSTGPTIPPPSCSGIGICYCVCRYHHRCDQNPSECNPLSQCLYSCDAQYPNCPYPGGGYPPNLLACYTGGG